MLFCSPHTSGLLFSQNETTYTLVLDTIMCSFLCLSFFYWDLIACEEKLITIEMGNVDCLVFDKPNLFEDHRQIPILFFVHLLNLVYFDWRWIFTGKTQCQSCKKKCSGEVLRVQDKYFHIQCFKCRVCQQSLAQGGFFCKDGEYYCTRDYQDRFGTKCSHCGRFVEGEVVTALGKTYHSSCFTCARCRSLPFYYFLHFFLYYFEKKIEISCLYYVSKPTKKQKKKQLRLNAPSGSLTGRNTLLYLYIIISLLLLTLLHNLRFFFVFSFSSLLSS